MRTLANLIQSAIAAVAVSVTAWTTLFFVRQWFALHEERKHLPPGTGHVHGVFLAYVDVRSLPGMLLLAAAVLIFGAIFGYCFFQGRKGLHASLALVGGVLSFFAGWLLTFSLIWLGLRNNPPQPAHEFKVVIDLILFFATSIAAVAFYAGTIGGWWLGVRSRRIHSMGRLLVESAIAGAVLGNLIPLFYLCFLFSLGNWLYSSPNTSIRPFAFVACAFCSFVGLVVAEIFAVVFRRRLVAIDEPHDVAS